jgi:hypothetical protein
MQLATDQGNSRQENGCNSYPEFRIHAETVLAAGSGSALRPRSGSLTSPVIKMPTRSLHQRILR